MAKKVDLIGMRYGKLTVVERTDQREGRYTDGVDDVLCKVMLAKKRKLKIKYI